VDIVRQMATSWRHFSQLTRDDRDVRPNSRTLTRSCTSALMRAPRGMGHLVACSIGAWQLSEKGLKFGQSGFGEIEKTREISPAPSGTNDRKSDSSKSTRACAMFDL